MHPFFYAKTAFTAVMRYINGSKQYNNFIYLITDEPYRELVYGNVTVPYLMNH